MAHDIKLTSDKGDMQKRVNDRLKSSGEGANPDVMVKTGNSPTRTITHIHNHPGQHGTKRMNPDGGGR
jgi:hypothetical protein